MRTAYRLIIANPLRTNSHENLDTGQSGTDHALAILIYLFYSLICSKNLGSIFYIAWMLVMIRDQIGQIRSRLHAARLEGDPAPRH